jgi:hypothetical protein
MVNIGNNFSFRRIRRVTDNNTSNFGRQMVKPSYAFNWLTEVGSVRLWGMKTESNAVGMTIFLD